MSAALEVRGLQVTLGGRTILLDFDLDLMRGAHLLLVGPSGSGKTTLLRAIAGLTAVSKGTIKVHGRLVQDGPRCLVPPQERGLGLVFQGGALWPHMTVRETLRFVLRQSGQDRGSEQARIAQLLAEVELTGREQQKAATLSGGEAQRLALARALAPRPGLLLLDEPLGPLDQDLRQALLQRLAHLAREHDLSLLHVTHDPEEARAVASGTLSLMGPAERATEKA